MPIFTMGKKNWNRKKEGRLRNNGSRSPRNQLGTPGLSSEEQVRYNLTTNQDGNTNVETPTISQPGVVPVSLTDVNDNDFVQDTIIKASDDEKVGTEPQEPAVVPKQQAPQEPMLTSVNNDGDDGATTVSTRSTSGINPEIVDTVRTAEKAINDTIRELRVIGEPSDLQEVQQELFANSGVPSAPNDHTAGLNNDGINSGDTDQNEVENEEEDSFVNDQIVGGTKTEKNEFPFFGKFGDHSLFTCIYLYSPYSFFLASTYYI